MHPITLSTLRNHFKTTYNLKDDQIELMLQSSAKSIRATFLEMEKYLASSDENLEQLVGIAHNLKGLLMNMGEMEWAETVKEIEFSARNATDYDYKGTFSKMRVGMDAIWRYHGG